MKYRNMEVVDVLEVVEVLEVLEVLEVVLYPALFSLWCLHN